MPFPAPLTKPHLPQDPTLPEVGFFRDYELNLIISIAVKASDLEYASHRKGLHGDTAPLTA